MKKVINNRTYLMWTSVLLLVFTFSCNEDRVSEFQFGSIKGRVVEKGTNRPIPNAKVFTDALLFQQSRLSQGQNVVGGPVA